MSEALLSMDSREAGGLVRYPHHLEAAEIDMNRLGEIHWEYTSTVIGHQVIRRPAAFRWEGPPVAAVSMRAVKTGRFDAHLRAGDQVQIGPFACRVVEFNPEGYYIVRRTDQNRLVSWLFGAWYQFQQRGRVIRSRFILTLAIWDLAEWPQGDEPGWIHVRRRFKKTNG